MCPRLTIPDPKKRLWSGLFPGEEFGEIFAARGIDLERNKGKVGLADSYSEVFDSVDDADLTTPIAFVRSSADNTDRWWANAGVLFKTSGTNPETGWAQDAIGSSPTAPLYDLIDFLGALLAPTSTNIDRLSAGAWTANWWSSLTGASALQSGKVHRFFILAGALCITDGRFVNDYDGTIARDPALTLPVGFDANFGLVFGGVSFIGGEQIGGGEAHIYTWDRTTTNHLARYPIGDTEALGGWVADSVYIVTKKGMIKRFNGNGFGGENNEWQFPSVEFQGQINSLHPNGISVSENVAKMIVDFGVIANNRLVSGIWNFDMKTGNLYNAGSVRNTVGRDYAQYELAGVGALKQSVVTQGLYLVGARVYTAYSGTTRYGIFSSDEEGTENQGYFITSKIHASSIRNLWRFVFPVLRRMDGAGDRVRIAMRANDSNELPAYETITWITASTLTASNADIAVGDWVEVLAGDNAGAIARITGISGTTVTIDRSLFSSTSTSRVRYLRFIDLGNIANVQVQSARFISTIRSEWIQFLIEFRGTETSPRFESLLIDFSKISV